ncbi:ATP-dependent DNA helicase RecG [Patescibacteria group bacterium]|nr:ATP-dependent DNA helicase RecG [Patescibacteria group bacterium]MBU1015704.1 ATP-dependent DNA helicase RecG [Patescibacteria group bacterium]MBU1685214.1 ATP-dependent DNA helicase RecG [Patescibacteria group bacterium]MBU1939057.1 ATP-dependent DNA helicase RecG [Patescibacteria group bacterium]
MQLSTPLSEAISTKKEYIRALSEIGLNTVEDLLLYFPRAYEDLSEFKGLHEAKDGEVITTKGFLQGIKLIPTKNRKMKLVKAMFYDQAGYESEVVWFNQPHLLRTLPMDREVVVSGKVQWSYGKITLQSPVVEKSKEIQIHAGTTVPIYPQHDVITSKWLREKIHPLLYLAKELPEVLPEEILEEEKLMPKALAVQEIHFPGSQEKLEAARDRLGYEELFLLQLRSLRAKKEWRESRPEGADDSGMPLDPEYVKQFFATLPFTPTNAQKIVIYEILKDMEKPFPMMRLLEGDVGSGKTVVAVVAALQAVKHGYQVAIMAPTEVLARQHLISLGKFLEKYPDINIQLLVSALKTAEKNQVIDALANGQVDIVVGTHALIQEGVSFENLGLVIVDEQHRFGVKQREVLVKQGSPHVLNMTATPIPRTLALVAYGDQDLSVINEMPPGRMPIETKIVPPEHRQAVYRFVEGRIQKGEQVYVICPLIDESDVLDEVKSVKKEFEHLQTVFSRFKVGLLHGKMKSEEKEAVMAAFKANEIQVLVSTSVIEVGVDVPNATVMLIEGAERFGLSQLHQFRGRVGRGKVQSYCFLYTNSSSDNTVARLKAMTDHTDGFMLAEIDLRLRGPGEVYGVRQSGLPDLKIANLMNGVLLDRVRKAAESFLERSAA